MESKGSFAAEYLKFADMASAFKNHAARMAGNVRRLQPTFPDRLKGGKLEKIYKYFSVIAQDYKAAFAEVGQDMRSRPLKSSIYVSALTSLGVLVATNPSKTSFKAQLIGNSQDLLLVGAPIRNPYSDSHIKDIALAEKDGKLRFLSLGFLTLVWKSHHSDWVGLYDAHCKQVNPRWTDIHKHIVDVGVFGRWIYMDKAMVDYDINPDEWDKEGKKITV